MLDENSDDETRELVNDINISENFSERSQVPTIENTIREVYGESDDSDDDDFYFYHNIRNSKMPKIVLTSLI